LVHKSDHRIRAAVHLRSLKTNMPLFDDIPRADHRPRRQNESTFAYMNASARPGICAIRRCLEDWFAHVPVAAQANLRGRFRSQGTSQNEGAFFELYWHELLLLSGCELQIHPPLDVSTSPDFLASRAGLRRFYVEATLAMPPGDAAADRRFAELHDTLDRMNSPNFFLDIQFRGDPQGNFRGRALRERLERWLEQLDHDEISRLYREHGHDAVPSFTWPEQGCVLTFTPIPKGPTFRGQPDVRAVGIVMPMELRELRTHDDIRAAIIGKAAKYGDLGLPLVVAINVLDDFCEDDDIWNALFGDEQVVAIREQDGQWRHEWGRRLPNGAWIGRNGPRNGVVSAVSIVHQLSPSTLRTRSVQLIHNPWAQHPLPPDYLALPQLSITPATGQIQQLCGTFHADLLNIPNPWPVQD
jgi:hypothetical protein